MREKKEWLVLAFRTTTDALQAECFCREHGIPGRIIPLPTEISAGCGLAFRTEPGEKERLIRAFAAHGLRWETMRTLMLS